MLALTMRTIKSIFLLRTTKKIPRGQWNKFIGKKELNNQKGDLTKENNSRQTTIQHTNSWKHKPTPVEISKLGRVPVWLVALVMLLIASRTLGINCNRFVIINIEEIRTGFWPRCQLWQIYSITVNQIMMAVFTTYRGQSSFSWISIWFSVFFAAHL